MVIIIFYNIQTFYIASRSSLEVVKYSSTLIELVSIALASFIWLLSISSFITSSNTLQNNRHTKFHDGNQSTVVDCFPNQLAEIQ